MIDICPFCGEFLNKPIENGITSCQNCMRVIDESLKNRLLSASWACRHNHLRDAKAYVKERYKLPSKFVDLLEATVIRGSMCHDEFLQHINKIHIKPS
jgi:hypothetical protein